MRKPVKWFVAGVTGLGIIIFAFRLIENREVSDAEKAEAFTNLLNDWELHLPVDYKVTHFNERTTHSEWGTVLIYFRLDLPKEQAERLLGDPQLKTMLWSKRLELLPVVPKIDWWKAETNAAIYKGFWDTKDTTQYIRLNIVMGTNAAQIFVESLTRKGERKKTN
jgi:hypothetical protein